MPRNPRRRRPTSRRSLPPRPTYKGAPETPEEEQPERRTARRRERTPQVTYEARETPYLSAELRRVIGVSAACAGLLGVLVIVDRL